MPSASCSSWKCFDIGKDFEIASMKFFLFFPFLRNQIPGILTLLALQISLIHIRLCLSRAVTYLLTPTSCSTELTRVPLPVHLCLPRQPSTTGDCASASDRQPWLN